MPRSLEFVSIFRLRLSSPITFLIAFLSPCLLYYADLPNWFLLQLALQLLICLLGICVATWRITAFVCVVFLVFYNYSWFAPQGKRIDSCIANADFMTGTVHASSFGQKSTLNLIRVVLSCKTDSVKIPMVNIAVEGIKMRNAYFRAGDVVELSHFILRRQGIWEVKMVPSDKTKLFNLTRKKRVLHRSALLIYIQNKARYYMAQFPASIFQALITADNSKMQKQWKIQIRELGIAHLFAISGMHIGIIYLWIVCLLRMVFAFPLKIVANGYLLLLCDLVALGVIFLFVDLIGMPISARRAFTMLVWWVVLRHFVFWQPLWFILLGTASLVLIEQPIAINQLSFQLSFVAVAGILILVPYLPLRERYGFWGKKLIIGLYSSILISGWLSLIMFPLVNRIFPYLYPIAVFGNVIHIFYMGWFYLPIGLLTMGLTIIGFPFYGFPGEYFILSVANFFGKLWESLMAINVEWNRALFWEFQWHWTGWHLVTYWILLLGIAWLPVRLGWVRKRRPPLLPR